MKKTDFQALMKASVFNGLSQNDITDITEKFALESVSYEKHEFIFTPENYSKSLAIILKGCADVYKQTEKGPLFLSILSPGDIFGMAAMFFEENGFINTVCARENTRVLFISKEQLTALFSEYPICAENYIRVLSEKIHYLNSKIFCLTSPSPTARLLSWLLNESERQGKNEFTVPVAYSELALILSLGRTSLYRSFDELEAQGKIARDGKTVKIINK